MDIYVSRYMKQLLNLPINNCINQFQQFLINLGLQVGALKVKQTGLKAKVNRYLHQPWFDEKCMSTKRKLKATLRDIHKFYSVERLKTYLASKKYYKHLLRSKKRKAAVELNSYFTKLHTTNSKEFWKTLDLKGNSNQRATGTKMDKQEVFNHFKQLHHKIIEPTACKSTAQLAKEKEVFEVIRTSKIRQSEWAGWFLHRSSKMLCKQ